MPPLSPPVHAAPGGHHGFLEPCILLTAALLSLLCLFYPTEGAGFVASSDYLGPDGFPTAVCVLLLAACGLRLVLWFKERKALLGQRLFAATEQRTLFGKTFLMILLFILSFIHVGFYATILVYFAVFPLLLEGVKNVRPAALAAYAGGLALTCWVIFRCFKIYLPEPLLF